MRILKGILIYNVTMIVVLVLALFFARPFLAEKLRVFVIQKYAEKELGELGISKIEISSLYPIQIKAHNVSASYLPQNLEFKSEIVATEATFEFEDFKSIKSVNLKILMKNRVLTVREAAAEESEQYDEPTQKIADSPKPKVNLNLELITENGEINILQRPKGGVTTWQEALKLKNENFRIAVNHANQINKHIEIDFNALVEVPQFLPGRQLPVMIQTKELELQNLILSSKKSMLKIAGVAFDVDGVSQLATREHRWHAKIDIPKIESLPIPPSFLPQGQWQGGLYADVELVKSQYNPISIKGVLQSRKLSADLKWSKAGLTVEGPVIPVVDLAFEYGRDLSINKAKLDVNLTQARVQYIDLINKPQNINLQVDILGHGDLKTIDLESINLKFAHMDISAQAKVNVNEPTNSQFAVQVRQTQLAGLENFILPLKDVPVKGTFEFSAAMNNGAVEFRKVELRSNLGLVRASGRIQNLKQPNLNMAFDLSNLSIKEALRFAPEFTNTKANGTVNAQVKLTGDFLPEQGLQTSPLTLRGAISAQLTQFVVPSSSPAPAAQTTPQNNPSAEVTWAEFQKQMAELPEEKPLLPNWPILKNSDLSINMVFKSFIYEKSQFENLNVSGMYVRGAFQGRGAIQKIYQGQLVLNDIRATNMIKPPRFSSQFEAKNLSLNELATQFAPTMLNYLQAGQLSNRMSISTGMPGTKNWLLEMSASGQLTGKNIKSKENVFEKVIGEKLASIAKSKKIISQNGTPLVMDVFADYSLAAGVANLKRFHMLDTEQNEFEGQGRAWTNLQADMKGKLFLSNLEVPSGIKKANSDAKGRLVVPVTFKGSLLNPGFDVATSTLQDMTKNIIKYEAQNLKESLGEKLKDKKTQDKLKNAVKGLFKTN